MTGIKFIKKVADEQKMVAVSAKIVYQGTALEKYHYKSGSGLKIHLWTTEEYNPFFLRNAALEATREEKEYDLALIENLRFEEGTAEGQTASETSLIDPFINPLSRESFDRFCRLEDNSSLSLEQKAAHFMGAWSAYKRRQGYSQSGLDNAFLRAFSQYFTREELEGAKIHAGERRQEIGERSYQSEQQYYLKMSLWEINKGSCEEIVQQLGRCPEANVFAYCLKDRKVAVDMAMDELRAG